MNTLNQLIQLSKNVATDETRNFTRGILLEYQNYNVTATRTCGHTLAQVNLDVESPDLLKLLDSNPEGVLIDATSLQKARVAKKSEATAIAVTETGINLSIGPATYVCPFMADKFPNYKAILEFEVDKKTPLSTQTVSLDLTLLTKIMAVFKGYDSDILQFTYDGPNKPVRIKAPFGLAVIMPVSKRN